MLLLSFTVRASDLACPAYEGDRKNFLTGVAVFNALSVSDKTIYTLAPDKQISRQNFMIQYWSSLNEDKTLKSFFTCLYKNNLKITLEIPLSIHHCQFKFNYLSGRVHQAKFHCQN
jgi:hypothetical protein